MARPRNSTRFPPLLAQLAAILAARRRAVVQFATRANDAACIDVPSSFSVAIGSVAVVIAAVVFLEQSSIGIVEYDSFDLTPGLAPPYLRERAYKAMVH